MLGSSYAVKIGDTYKHCKSGVYPKIGFVAVQDAPYLDFIFLCQWYIRTLDGVPIGQYLDVASGWRVWNPARLSDLVRTRLDISRRTEIDLMRTFDQSLLYLVKQPLP